MEAGKTQYYEFASIYHLHRPQRWEDSSNIYIHTHYSPIWLTCSTNLVCLWHFSCFPVFSLLCGIYPFISPYLCWLPWSRWWLNGTILPFIQICMLSNVLLRALELHAPRQYPSLEFVPGLCNHNIMHAHPLLTYIFPNGSCQGESLHSNPPAHHIVFLYGVDHTNFM